LPGGESASQESTAADIDDQGLPTEATTATKATHDQEAKRKGFPREIISI
jgi:hypothetical protein